MRVRTGWKRILKVQLMHSTPASIFSSMWADVTFTEMGGLKMEMMKKKKMTMEIMKRIMKVMKVMKTMKMKIMKIVDQKNI